MSDREYIEALVRGADLYRKQGLDTEAREKYLEALSYVSKHQSLINHSRLREIIENRIHLVDNNLADVDHLKPPDLPRNVQDLVKNLFTFSGTREGAALEGAVALLKFGQYRRALEEFEGLLAQGVRPLTAAKNIITCTLLLDSPEVAIARFRQWLTEDVLSSQELMYVREFLQSALVERRIEAELPYPSTRSTAETCGKEKEEISPEISMVTIMIGNGLHKDRTEELKVSFQFGNVISVVVPSSRKDLIQVLNPGARFHRMEFYSPMAFFRGMGRITGKNMIKQGPRKGDYLLDIAIEEE